MSQSMDLQLLPDSVALLVLMGVLAWARRRYRDHSVDWWLLGLSFILVEDLAVVCYRLTPVLHRTLHTIALDGYVLAAITFSWAARKDFLPSRLRVPLSSLPALPLFAIATAYGAEVTERRFYLVAASLSLVAGFVFMTWLARGRLRERAVLYAAHLAMWVPMIAMASFGSLRWVVYWGLACLYLVVAASFRGRLRRDGVGGMAIVSGFTVWAICFLLHPILRSQPVAAAVLQQVWNMQKFLVILGMLLLLLEEQTRRREEEAMHDALTGLPNRRLFDDRLSLAMERASRSGTFCALFVVDLDDFKQVNDRHGHARGDEVLRLAARQLATQVRSTDTLARCGGDEFSVIVGDLSNPENCELIAGGLRRAVAAGQTELAGDAIALACSVGYAIFPRDALDAVGLGRTADAHMYEQKRQNRRLGRSA